MIPAKQGVTFGVRAVKLLPETAWMKSNAQDFSAVPHWLAGGKTYRGEELWLKLDTPTGAGDPLQTITSQCPNIKTVQVRVQPNCTAILRVKKNDVLAGLAPLALKLYLVYQ